MNSKSVAFMTPVLDVEEHAALKALSRGEATPGQQQMALYVVVNKFSRANETLYIPGSFDETAFLEGRGFVGQRILMYLKKPVGRLGDLSEEQSGG